MNSNNILIQCYKEAERNAFQKLEKELLEEKNYEKLAELKKLKEENY